jgi:UDPglucose 6-dehydrogenase
MPLDINKTNFVRDPSFKLEDATVGIVGHGYVGQAVDAFFRGKCHVLVNDKAKPDMNSLKDVVEQSEVIFVCVPTPMRKDGTCFTGIVDEVLGNIRDTAKEIKRRLDTFVIVIKSTLPPGYMEETENRNDMFGMRLVFSPEFLTEAASVKDFQHCNRHIFGGDQEDALVVCRYFHDVQPERVKNGQLLLVQCEPSVAEMVKLFTNGILMTKVIFSNEVFKMCEKLGIRYEEVRAIACLDQRIGASHTMVPGPDGKLGAGGSCFPKDINNLRSAAKMMETGERIFSAVVERNNELRPEKDWEELKGRAVTDQ